VSPLYEGVEDGVLHGDGPVIESDFGSILENEVDIVILSIRDKSKVDGQVLEGNS
jgi:hypothetical protein